MKAHYSSYISLYTLTKKEIARFISVYLQTIVAPIVTTVLYFIVFATVFSGQDRQSLGLPFMQFLAPGLIMMSMAQNAFANTSSSLISGKMWGNLADVVMAPLNNLQMLMGYVMGGIGRGVLIGFCSSVILYFFVDLPLHSFLWIAVFSVLGCTMLATLGVIGGILSDKFDHLSVITNFVITPLTFLSGTFYSLERLEGGWQQVAFYNPFLFMIDGFRYGVLGVSDAPVMVSFIALLVILI